MFSKIFRFLLGVMLMLVASALLAFNALLIWVATGPRSLETVTPYIESALSASDGSYHVEISETKLIWDGWKHPVDIRLSNVSVINKEGKAFTSFPEISLSVDILYLPLGKIMPTSLTVISPRLSLVQNDDRSFGFSFEQNSGENLEAPAMPLSTAIALFFATDKDSNFRRLHTMILRGAEIVVKNSSGTSFFDTKNVNLTLNRNKRGEINARSNATIYYKDYNADIKSELHFKPTEPEIKISAEFSEILPHILASLFSDNKDAQSFAVPVRGAANVILGTDGILRYIGFIVRGQNGNIVSDKLIAPLPVTSLEVLGEITNSFNNIKISSLNADLDGIKIAAQANVNLFDIVAEPDATPEIMANINVKNVASEKVKLLWPPSLSPMSREWVTENISEGKVTEDTIKINIKKGDLSKAILPKEAIDANIHVDGLKIRYLPEHPPATNVKGIIHIDGLSLTANIESADYLEKTKLSNGKVIIADLNADNPYINVELQADAPARDIVHFLDLPRLQHAKHLGLQKENISGHVKGNAKVGFNFFAPENVKAEDAIVYDVKAEVENITQNKFLHKFDIEGAKGTVSVDNKAVTFSGIGTVNDARVSKSDVKYIFTPDKGFDTFIYVTANVPKESLVRFGYPDFPFLSGSMEVGAKVKLGDKNEQNEASINLENTEVKLIDIGWHKPKGEAAKLDITTEKNDGAVKINSFNLSGSKISAKGSAQLAGNLSEFSNISLKQVSFGKNDVENLTYENTGGTMRISTTANSIDMSSYIENNKEGFSSKNFPATELNANVKELFLGKDKKIADFKGVLSCSQNICQNANITGKTGDNKPFIVRISKENNKRQIAISSEDAGSFLHNFGVMDGASGGILTLRGDYQDSSTGSVLRGKLHVSEHLVKDAPVLGKILSLASLTGFFDTLQGNGIRFKALAIPFTLADDVITIEKGRSFGSAMGVTVDGTITLPKKTLDLQGTVIPSYTFNNVLGKVPLFGDILTGGEGQGVFAARYGIKGEAGKEEVIVNPLSILTPGFLRGFFDIFEDQKPENKN